MNWRRGRYAALMALVGAVFVFALGAAPASAASTYRSSTTVPPDASFTITPSPDYPSGQTLTFSANQTVDPNGGTLTYAWAVDGTTTTNTGSSFSQAFTGTHTITLTVTDSEGDPPQSTTQTIDQLPDASFGITPSAPYHPGQNLTFTANSTTDPNGGTLSYAWTVDGNSTPVSTASSFSQAFASGPHSITLTVTDSEGDPAQSSTQNITVDTLPSALFTITPSPDYPSGQTLTFSANQTVDPNGGTLTYAWAVDGTTTTNTGSSFSQAFTGTHTITLTVTDSEGDPPQSTTQTIDQLPDASFGITPSAPYHPGQNLTFTANSTTDPNGGTLSYAWTVDGNSTPVSTASSFSQAFASGPHSITLTVTDSEGDPAQSSTQNITVDTLPSASFTITPASTPYVTGQNLTFTANSTTDPNGGTLTYAWTVDGNSTPVSTASSFSQTFTSGPHTITLTVNDSEGDPPQSSTQTIDVDAPMSASIAVFPSTPSVGTVIAFTGTRTGDPDESTATYAWRFGDGTGANGASVQHIYQEAGTYTVGLKITDADGQQATSTQRVTVAPLASTASPPTARFTAPQGRQGTPVAFDGSASRDPNPGGTLGYRWTFGDGAVGAGVHASHAFRAGTWTVTLTVTDNASGLSNSVSHAVTISAPACVVPALRGKLVAAARRALQAAHCSLGHTTTPKRPTRSPGKHKRWQLVVASQSPRSGRVRAKGATVRVTLVWRAIAV